MADFIPISSVRTQPDAPVDTTLMTNLADNDVHVNDRMGITDTDGGGLPTPNHAHLGFDQDGTAQIAGTTGGVNIASGLWIGQTDPISMNLARFQPEFMMFAPGSRRNLDVNIKHSEDDLNESTSLNTGIKSTGPGISLLTLGGAALLNTSLYNTAGDAYAGLLLKSTTSGIKVGTYAGSTSGQPITGIGFRPEAVLVWRATSNVASIPVIKTIGMASADSKEFGGIGSPFSTNQIISFDIDGFTVGTDNQVNNINIDYAFLALKSFPGGESIAVNTYAGDGLNGRVLFTNGVDNTGFNPQWAWIIDTDIPGSNRGGVVAPIEMSGAVILVVAQGSNLVESFTEGGILISSNLSVNALDDNYVVIFFQSGVRP